MRTLVAAVTVALALLPAVPLRGAGPTAAELASSLQRKYDGMRDFSADFVHTYRGGVLRKALSEKGRLLIKRPGKMRWEYTEPEKKTFVSDGLKLYSYIPQDRQVIVASVPRDDTPAAPALFLTGKGNLTRDFDTALVDVPGGSPAGAVALKLTPRTPQADYDSLILIVDGPTLVLRGLASTDAQGGTSSFSFSNLKENVGLTDKIFAFQIPSGVDVVTDSGRR